MSETEDLPVPRTPQEESPATQPRLEESREWVIETYRKHQLIRVSAWLDQCLGEGKRSKNYIAPVLLDTNPVHHRQSIQDQVYPNPRIIHEGLLDTGQLKMMLRADYGMGKTTFLKVFQELLLQQPPHPVYSLPVYVPLADLPENTGLSHFMEQACREIQKVVLLEKDENPALDLSDELLLGTIESLIRESRIIFLIDGLDQMPSEDRFQAWLDLFVEDRLFRSNVVLVASRPFEFGPLATDTIIKRGQDGAFQIEFERIQEKARNAFLGDAAKNRALNELAQYSQELLDVPLLLHIIRMLQQHEVLEKVNNRGELYASWLTIVMRDAAPSENEKWAAQCLNHLEEVSFRLMEAGESQRFDELEFGFSKNALALDTECTLISDGKIVSGLEAILAETPGRWAFRHPSFQDYFAARKLARLSSWQDVVRQHCRDPEWEGAIQFLAGMLPADELFDVLLEEGAVFLAGNSIREARDLSNRNRLLTAQLLKYQCRETFPQFSRHRLIRVHDVIDANNRDTLLSLLLRMLERDKRDSRVLFSVLELLLALKGIDLHQILDTQNYAPLQEVEELKLFLSEADNKDIINSAVMKRWGEMVTVSAGKFIYQEERDEEDKVNLREFSIMKFPVTNALYREFDPNYRPAFPKYSLEEDHPVIGVNFYEAVVFSIWFGKRLPLEKEWEKAARGTDGRDYPWGEAMGYQTGYVNTADFMVGRTTPVTEFEEGISPFGCFDMAGNVWEWCVQMNASRHTTQKVVRGGSWLNYMVHAKCTFRNSFDPDERHPAVGIRCMTLPLTEIEEDEEEED